ncbi:MAG: restriction endonuclease subunit S [Saprospiraceae bacterium]|nr:restriction endonuclease subunit S [Saprospiraceae bacterium]
MEPRNSDFGFNATTNQAICSIEPNKEILNSKYLYYFLFSIRDQIIAGSTGGAQPNISQAYVKEIPILSHHLMSKSGWQIFWILRMR